MKEFSDFIATFGIIFGLIGMTIAENGNNLFMALYCVVAINLSAYLFVLCEVKKCRSGEHGKDQEQDR